MEINILIEGNISLEPDWLQGVAEQVLSAVEAGADVELSLVITGQERVQELNRDYRGIDEPTDVLAFAMGKEVGTHFAAPPDGITHLGEVIISYPQAVIQAEECHHPVEREVTILLIHGILHLLGFDHEKPEEERTMRAKEAEILSLVEGGKS